MLRYAAQANFIGRLFDPTPRRRRSSRDLRTLINVLRRRLSELAEAEERSQHLLRLSSVVASMYFTSDRRHVEKSMRPSENVGVNGPAGITARDIQPANLSRYTMGNGRCLLTRSVTGSQTPGRHGDRPNPLRPPSPHDGMLADGRTLRGRDFNIRELNDGLYQSRVLAQRPTHRGMREQLKICRPLGIRLHQKMPSTSIGWPALEQIPNKGKVPRALP
jgi:hypothetical protein